MTIRVAHLSDLHVLDLSGTSWTRFLNKRVTGLANLAGARRNAHPIAIARKLGDAVRAAGADHVLITGDLTNLSLDSEMTAARAVVEAIGPPERVTLVPGNHDVYTRGSLQKARFEGVFDDYLPPAAGGAGSGRDRYPIARDIGEGIRVYGLSSAIPAPPFCAWGEVGAAQLQRLADAVAAEPEGVTARIVLVHHNLHQRGHVAERTAQLRDRPALARTLRSIGATLLLHGHTHDPNQWHLPANGDGGTVLVLGCGSSTQSKPEDPDRARFNLLTFEAGALVSAQAHQWRSREGAFEPQSEDLLANAHRRALAL